MDVKADPKGRRTDAPLYAQVSRTLKEEIVSGAWPVGSLLPTEDELCARFSVSRYTVREALRRLREDGLVSSRQGAGTVVVPPPAAGSHALQSMSINDLVDFGTRTRFAIDSIRMVTVDAKLAARIGVAIGEERLAVTGYRYDEAEKDPVCWTEYYIHRDFAAVGRLLHRHTGPIFQLVEDLFAVSVAEVHQEIGAALVTAAQAEGFRVKPGSPVLEVRRTYKMTDGRIGQITINTHPASRFRHSMVMRRVKA
jgi:DNA-binding GntR family transcriptional regulator